MKCHCFYLINVELSLVVIRRYTQSGHSPVVQLVIKTEFMYYISVLFALAADLLRILFFALKGRS